MSVGLWVASEKTQEFHRLLKTIEGKNWNLYNEPGN